MSKTLLRVAGGFEIFCSLVGAGISLILFFIFGVSIFTMLPMLLPLATAIIFMYVASLNENGMREYQNWVLVFSVLAFCTANILVGILGVIAYLELKGHSPTIEKKVVDKRMRKMSLLLTLGVLLIVVAGVVFATSTWEILDGFVKTCVLIVASLLFFGISNLAEHKLKLTKSAITYYVLGSFFVVAAYLAVGFFEVFGSWFSFNGIGQNLFFSSFWLFTMVVALSAYWKYQKTGILYLVEGAATLAVIFLLGFIGLPVCWSFFILLLFFGLIMLADQREKLPTLTIFSNGMFVITVFVLMLFVTMVDDLNVIVTTVNVIWVATLLYVVGLRRNRFSFRVLAPIVSLVLFAGVLLLNGENGLMFLTKFAVIALVIYAIGLMKREDKILFGSTLAVTDVAFLYLIFDALRLEFGYFAIVVAGVFLLLSFLSIIGGKLSEFHFERFLEPVKVALLTYTIYDLLMTRSFVDEAIFFGIMALIFALVQFVKKGLLKNIYFWTAFGCALLTMGANLAQGKAIVMPAFVAIVFGILFLAASHNMEWKAFGNVLYALFTVSLLFVVYRVTALWQGVVFYLMALALVYLVLGLLFPKRSLLRNISFMTALFPLYIIISRLELSSEWMTIVSALIALLFIIGYTRGVLDGASMKLVNILEIVAIGFWFVALIFNADFIQGIVLGTVAILFVLLGYKSDKMWSYYYVGIGATILNLWQQLKSVWSKIPFWAYLLFAGLVLVGFVTYQEYTGQKKIEEEKEPVLEKEEVAVLEIASERVISGTIIYLVIFLSMAEIIL